MTETPEPRRYVRRVADLTTKRLCLESNMRQGMTRQGLAPGIRIMTGQQTTERSDAATKGYAMAGNRVSADT